MVDPGAEPEGAYPVGFGVPAGDVEVAFAGQVAGGGDQAAAEGPASFGAECFGVDAVDVRGDADAGQELGLFGAERGEVVALAAEPLPELESVRSGEGAGGVRAAARVDVGFGVSVGPSPGQWPAWVPPAVEGGKLCGVARGEGVGVVLLAAFGRGGTDPGWRSTPPTWTPAWSTWL